MKATGIGWLVVWLAAAASSPVLAQDDDEEGEASEEASEASDEGSAEADGGDDEGDGDAAQEKEGDDGAEPAAPPRSWYFGPYLRYAVLPAFMLELFLDEAPTVDNAAFGIAANHRNPDGASFQLGLGYTPLSFNGPVRASGDPEEDTEWIDSDLGMLHATASILWTLPIVEHLAFEYGLGIDLGLLLGDMVRTEAYKSGDGFARCPGVIPFPQPGSTFCEPPRALPTDPYDKDGAHYGVVEERIPPIAGSLMLPHLTLRYEPIPELAVKLEGALGFPMFFLGLSAAYGPEL